MRLKTTLSKQIQLLENKNLNTLLIGDDNRGTDLMLNTVSNTSTSGSSASAGIDDLEMDSADDDEIDVGTNADYGNSNANTSFDSFGSSAALNGIKNDHQFCASQSGFKSSGTSKCSSMSDADRKRAHHNALERKRRDHIKDSFHTLRDAIPNIRGEKTSRAQILKAATDYIKIMKNRNIDFQNDIDNLKKSNLEIENQIRQLEKARQEALGLLGSQQISRHEPKEESSESGEDFHFDLTETNQNNSIQMNQQLTSTNSCPNQVLVLNKSSILPNTITTTSLANSKKLKTFINTKNNINIINLSKPNVQTSTLSTSSAVRQTDLLEN